MRKLSKTRFYELKDLIKINKGNFHTTFPGIGFEQIQLLKTSANYSEYEASYKFQYGDVGKKFKNDPTHQDILNMLQDVLKELEDIRILVNLTK